MLKLVLELTQVNEGCQPFLQDLWYIVFLPSVFGQVPSGESSERLTGASGRSQEETTGGELPLPNPLLTDSPLIDPPPTDLIVFD